MAPRFHTSGFLPSTVRSVPSDPFRDRGRDGSGRRRQGPSRRSPTADNPWLEEEGATHVS